MKTFKEFIVESDFAMGMASGFVIGMAVGKNFGSASGGRYIPDKPWSLKSDWEETKADFNNVVQKIENHKAWKMLCDNPEFIDWMKHNCENGIWKGKVMWKGRFDKNKRKECEALIKKLLPQKESDDILYLLDKSRAELGRDII